MKKIIVAVVALSLLISIPVFAAEAKKEEMPGMSMMGMGRMMERTQMVATDEGGVIVLAGNKLLKYDADLNLIKEVDVKMPMGPMGGKQCPMMGKMTDQDAPAVAESREKAAS